MTIGIKDGIISTTSPIIRGNTYGIESTKTLKIYDGKIMGITGAISGTVNEIETNSQLVDGTEVAWQVTTSRASQLVNALDPMLVTPLPMSMEVRPVQP